MDHGRFAMGHCCCETWWNMTECRKPIGETLLIWPCHEPTWWPKPAKSAHQAQVWLRQSAGLCLSWKCPLFLQKNWASFDSKSGAKRAENDAGWTCQVAACVAARCGQGNALVDCSGREVLKLWDLDGKWWEAVNICDNLSMQAVECSFLYYLYSMIPSRWLNYLNYNELYIIQHFWLFAGCNEKWMSCFCFWVCFFHETGYKRHEKTNICQQPGARIARPFGDSTLNWTHCQKGHGLLLQRPMFENVWIPWNIIILCVCVPYMHTVGINITHKDSTLLSSTAQFQTGRWHPKAMFHQRGDFKYLLRTQRSLNFSETQFSAKFGEEAFAILLTSHLVKHWISWPSLLPTRANKLAKPIEVMKLCPTKRRVEQSTVQVGSAIDLNESIWTLKVLGGACLPGTWGGKGPMNTGGMYHTGHG